MVEVEVVVRVRLVVRISFAMPVDLPTRRRRLLGRCSRLQYQYSSRYSRHSSHHRRPMP